MDGEGLSAAELKRGFRGECAPKMHIGMPMSLADRVEALFTS
jgi:hypothetical protein